MPDPLYPELAAPIVGHWAVLVHVIHVAEGAFYVERLCIVLAYDDSFENHSIFLIEASVSLQTGNEFPSFQFQSRDVLVGYDCIDGPRSEIKLAPTDQPPFFLKFLITN